ncbi:phage tail family protein [Sporosarcina psychrophila]|uniref:Phage tail protein n=1 Tax=Sporosarcina psychrophila TaxID=1476 RepID=A0ABV2KAQ5_SPOPS
MQKITYTNSRGDSIVLSHRAPFLLSKIDGLGDVDATVQMQKSPFQDGSTHVDTLLEPRFLSLQVSIIGRGREDVSAKREELARVFNPKLSGVILFENGRVSREIKAHPEHVPKYPSDDRGLTYQIALVNLVCPNPYWQDINPINIKLQDFVGNFFFPISFPASFSIRGDEKNLFNEGHAPTPIKVTFRGEAVNPMITKVSTGEFIRINRTIPAEHSLVITTDFDYRTVRIVDPYGNEKNAMGYIDLDGTFFSLDVGENNLKFITSGGNPEVFIEYRNLYLGV